MTTQIKSLMFVAAVAILPVACGTSGSPTGMEVAAIELDARRSEPMPPYAPQGDPGTIPAPDVKPGETTPDPTSVPTPDPTSVPLPVDRANRPQPGVTAPVVPPSEPSNSEAEPVEPAEPGNPEAEPVEPNDPNVEPAPQVTIPTTPQAPSDPMPAPTTPETDECMAVSIEIVFEGSSFGATGDRYRATVLDNAGLAISDLSCEKLAWEVSSESSGTFLLTVTPEGTRSAIVNGDGRAYKIGVTAPNGVSASMVLGSSANTGSR